MRADGGLGEEQPVGDASDGDVTQAVFAAWDGSDYRVAYVSVDFTIQNRLELVQAVTSLPVRTTLGIPQTSAVRSFDCSPETCLVQTVDTSGKASLHWWRAAEPTTVPLDRDHDAWLDGTGRFWIARPRFVACIPNGTTSCIDGFDVARIAPGDAQPLYDVAVSCDVSRWSVAGSVGPRHVFFGARRDTGALTMTRADGEAIDVMSPSPDRRLYWSHAVVPGEAGTALVVVVEGPQGINPTSPTTARAVIVKDGLAAEPDGDEPDGAASGASSGSEGTPTAAEASGCGVTGMRAPRKHSFAAAATLALALAMVRRRRVRSVARRA
jgi:hypothetical protein